MKVKIRITIGIFCFLAGIGTFAPSACGQGFNALLGAEGGRFYGIDVSGALRFYWVNEYAGTWYNSTGPIIGTGWDQYPQVFYGSTGVLYSVQSDGRLLYFLDADRDGSGQVSTNGVEITNGWGGFRWLIGDNNGVIYAIDDAGDLFFYQYYGVTANPAWYNNGVGVQIGSGWTNFVSVFGGRDGVIYAITDQGDLYWYRDLARDGSTNFANGGLPLVIGGGGWDAYRFVFSTGNGNLYGTTDDGNFYFYHLDVAGTNNNWTNFNWTVGRFIIPPPALEGYCWPLSVTPGEAVDFSVSGSGAIEVTFLHLKANAAGLASLTMGATNFSAFTQPISPQANTAGCGWTNSFTLTIPTNWPSGMYSAQLHDTQGRESHIVFIVKPGASQPSRLAVLANINTWNAYNAWGGGNKYDGVTQLSFLRPNPAVSPLRGILHLARAELWILSWLEDAGYRPDVYTDLDFERGMVSNNYRCVLLSTHPEYWTSTMYSNLLSFLDSGGSLVYMAGGGIFESCNYWTNQTGIYYPGATNYNAFRECYTWRHLGPPEMNVLGLALANCNCPSAPFEIMQASHRFFRDTGLTNGSTVGVVGLNTGVANGAAAGWEVDSSTDPAAYGNAGCLDSDCSFVTPTLSTGHVVLASAQCCNPAEIVTYPHPDGGLVFSAGSVLFGGSLAVDAQLQHIVGNVLDEALGFVCPPLPDGLIAWWRGEGNAEDFTGANPGTLSGSVTFASGKVGQAFSFSGADGYIALPANVFPFPANGTANVPMSFECWFKTSIQGVILGQQTDAPYSSSVSAVPAIYIGSDNLLRVEMFWNGSPAPITISNNVADGFFHHVAVVYDGTNQTVYLDSNLAGTAPHTQTAYRNGAYQYQLGTGCSGGGWPAIPDRTWVNFIGLIDEPSVYSRALTTSEVQSIFAAGSNGKSPLTIAPLSLASGSVDTSYTQSLSASNGTAPYMFSVSGGALPFGLSLSTSGVLSGTPTTRGSYSFTVTVADANRFQLRRAYTLDITGGCVPASAGLTGWWRAEGDAIDFTGANHGELEGAVAFAPGRVGQAFHFDGTSNVQVPASVPLNAYPITLTAWLRTIATGPEQRGIMSKYLDGSSNGFSLHLANGNLGAWYFRDPNDFVFPGGLGLDGGAVADGNWHHVAFSVGAGGGNLYVDGTLKNSASWVGAPGPPSSSEPLLIGRFDTNTPTFDGLIDEAALYSGELSDADIYSLFAAGSHGLCGHCAAIPAGLISWWRGQGDASDFAGANPGTFQGDVAFAPARVGLGFAFNGSNYVQVPTADPLNSFPLTLTTWLRTTATGPEVRGVLSKYQDASSNGFSLHLANGNIYAFYFHDADNYIIQSGGLGLSGGAVADGNWHHVAFAVGGSGGQLFVDGALKATRAWVGSPGAPSTLEPLLIGDYSTFMPTFDGMIDEPALYGRVLSAAEVLSLFAAAGHGVCVPPSLAVSSAGTNIQLRVIGTVGEAYQLQSAPIVTGPWMYLSPPQLADPTGNIDYTDATPAGQRFYRAVVADP